MFSSYVIYHGPNGITNIRKTLALKLRKRIHVFDHLTLDSGPQIRITSVVFNLFCESIYD